MSQFPWTSRSPCNLTTASLRCVRAPRLSLLSFRTWVYLISQAWLWIFWLTPKPGPHLYQHCLLSGHCSYSAEGWKIPEGSGDMGGEVGSIWIFGDISQAQFKEAASRRWFRWGRPPHIFVGREEGCRRENFKYENKVSEKALGWWVRK